MNVLLVTDAYPPEVRSSSLLMKELAQELVKLGHNTTVVTTQPRYNIAKNEGKCVFQEYADEQGIKVIRLRTLPNHKVNYVIRGISEITLPYIFIQKVKKYVNIVDVVIVYSPPLALGIVGYWCKKAFGAKFVLNVQDIFPQHAIDIEILKSRVLIKFFELVENRLYKIADKIVTHSAGNTRFLVEKKNVSIDKVVTLYNWIDIERFHCCNGNNYYRSEYELKNKFIILFAGIVGPQQNLELIIEVARRTVDLKDIVFLIVGDGSAKPKIEKLVYEYELPNVVLKPFISHDDYPHLVNESDVGLVCLSSKMKTPVVPGKILGYMASSIPVLAFLNAQSDGHFIIQESTCGYSTVSDNVDNMENLVRKMYMEKSRLKEYGKNGYEYAKKNFSKNVCVWKLVELFEN